MNRTDSGSSSDLAEREEFIQHLRYALVHLHEPERLRQSDLAALFGIGDRFDASRRLYSIIVDAIDELEPVGTAADLPNAYEIHETLLYRYVQQIPQKDVADQLGMGVRHLRRKQRAAFEALTDILWTKYDLDGVHREQSETETHDEQPAAGSSLLDDELSWLRDPGVSHQTDVSLVLPSVVETLMPLAGEKHVRIFTQLGDDLPLVTVNSVALRQMLLSLTSLAIESSQGGSLLISAKTQRWDVRLGITTTTFGDSSTPANLDWEHGLGLALRLAELSGAELLVADHMRSMAASLRLPTLERFPVLVVDDNEDFLNLVRRYASGTRYRMITTNSPHEALALAGDAEPGIIVLDVMMPETDGWELLSRMRREPRIGDIPVIVCSIVTNASLARSLGAAGCLQKPVSRESFLAALDQQAQPTG